MLSLITNHVLDYIYAVHAHRITQWNQDILNPVALQSYADAIYCKGAALVNCLGFINGNLRPVSSLSEHQRVCTMKTNASIR